MTWNIIVSISAAFSPILIVVLGGVGWLWKHEKERREIIETQLSEQKYKAHVEIINIFFDVIKGSNKQKPLTQEEIFDRMMDAGKNLIFYGSDKINVAYQNWINDSRHENSSLLQFAELVILIRQEMGYPKTKLTSAMFLRQFITDFDDMEAKGLLDIPYKTVKAKLEGKDEVEVK